MQVDNKTITGIKDVANEFNIHFTTVAKIIEKFIVSSQPEFTHYLLQPNRDSFFLDLTAKEEIQKEIKILKNKKSCAPSLTSLSKRILLIENLFFDINSFPETLKQANLTPIFKKDGHKLCNNYRPNSFLSNISKVIERIVNKRLTKLLNLKEMLHEKQFRFRHNH